MGVHVTWRETAICQIRSRKHHTCVTEFDERIKPRGFFPQITDRVKIFKIRIFRNVCTKIQSIDFEKFILAV